MFIYFIVALILVFMCSVRLVMDLVRFYQINRLLKIMDGEKRKLPLQKKVNYVVSCVMLCSISITHIIAFALYMEKQNLDQTLHILNIGFGIGFLCLGCFYLYQFWMSKEILFILCFFCILLYETTDLPSGLRDMGLFVYAILQVIYAYKNKKRKES